MNNQTVRAYIKKDILLEYRMSNNTVAQHSRAAFVSKLGGLLAVAGSAVGLGNIWRFPTQVGENGGSAFLLVYMGIILLFGVPLLLSEFVIGRRARANVGRAYTELAPRSRWGIVGMGSSLVAFAIFCYYVIIVAWVLYYFVQSLTGQLTAGGEGAHFKEQFTDFITNPYWPIVCTAVTMGIIHFIIQAGVEKGIERSSKFLMPALFIILLVLAVVAMFMPGAEEGYRFLFDFDPKQVTPSVCLSALGQCFYSFSIGMGLVTYASYFGRNVNLSRTALTVGGLDTMVAILAGLIIFPAVFSVPGLSPSSGAGLVFVSLPEVFSTAFSGNAILTWFVPTLFYFILFVAAVTSAMFLHEVATAFVQEKIGYSRKKSATLISVSSLIIACVASLSLGPWDFIRPFGMNLVDFLDYTTSKIILPLTGLGSAIFIGWVMKKEDVIDEITSGGTFRFVWSRMFLFIIRYIVPVLILVIMVSQFVM